MYANYELCLYASGSVPIQFKFELNLLDASSHDEPATANEPTSVELLAMFNRVFRKYFRTVLRRGQYYGKVIQSHPGICHCMLISRFPNYAWSIQMLMS